MSSKESNSDNSRDVSKASSVRARVAVPSKYKAAANDAARKGRMNDSKNASCDQTKLLTTKSCDKKLEMLALKKVPAKPARGSHLKVVQVKDEHLLIPNIKLHSTALNESTLFDNTQSGSNEMFSTTVVRGSNEERNCRMFSLSDVLPNISSITLSEEGLGEFGGAGGDTDSIKVSTASTKNKVHSEDYSHEDIEMEYLKYLTWVLLEAQSEQQYQKQVAEAEQQIDFLTSLIEREQDSLLEERIALEVVKHYDQVSELSQGLKKELMQLNETIGPVDAALQTLLANLESQMDQIKLENIFIPSDQEAYKAELYDVLKEIMELLSTKLNSGENLTSNQSETILPLIDSIDAVGPCKKDLLDAVRMAIHETSLRLTLHYLIKYPEKEWGKELPAHVWFGELSRKLNCQPPSFDFEDLF